MMTHEDALKKLMPIDLGSISDLDMRAEGSMLDQAAADIMQLLPELYPSTTDTLLSRWESEYGLTPKADATIATRRTALLARYVDIGNLSKAYFTALAKVLGYDIQIAEGGEANKMFRANYSAAGEPVYSTALMWEWTVTTTNKPAGQDLKDTFAAINPPHMALKFDFQAR